MAASESPKAVKLDVQAPAETIYRIAIEEFRSAGFHVEGAVPAMTALRVRKNLNDRGYFLIALNAKAGLWTVVDAHYELRSSWLFWKQRRTLHDSAVDVSAYEAILNRVKKRSEREPG